eukprot:gene8975-32130_t
MPALSPTMEEGTLVNWNVEVGEEVGAGDSLADIETDKAVMSFDSSEDGYIAKFLLDNGTQAKVGVPVLILCEEEEDIAAFADYEPAAAAAAPEPTAAATPAAAAPSAAAPAAAAAAPVVITESNSAIDASLYAAAQAAFTAKYPTGITA